MRIAVYGAGGIGGFMGAQLCRAGHDVALIARGEHLRAIQERGLQVEWPDGNYTVVPRTATDDPSQVGVVDLVILGVKAWQVPEAARALLPMVGSDTRVMTIQNGVEAPYQVAEVVPAERVIAGAMNTGGNIIRPGCIRRLGSNVGRGDIGQLATGGTYASEVQASLQGAGFGISVREDILASLWAKLVFTGWVGVEALSRSPIGVVRSIPQARKLMRQAAEEVVCVARTRGVGLGDEALKSFEEYTDRTVPAHFASAALDIVNGRPSELDAIVGAVVRIGMEAGVPTPVNEFIYAALLPQELKARGQIAWPT